MDSFLTDVLELIRDLARDALKSASALPLRLVAHLFAIEQYWHLHFDSPTVKQPPVGRTDADLPSMLQRLARLAPGSSDELFLEVRQALITFDDQLQPDRDDAWVEGRTPLKELLREGRLALGGSVEHWMRPASAWANLRRSRALMKSVNEYPEELDRLFKHLSMRWDLPGTIELKRVVNPRSRLAKTGLTGKGPRIALCPLPGAFHPRFVVGGSPGQRTFRVDPDQPMEREDELLRHLELLLADAKEHDLQLIVAPELSVSPAGVKHLSQLLRNDPSSPLLAVVAGSFHCQDRETLHNESPVLLPTGHELWRHRKKGYFRVEKKDVKAPLFPDPVALNEGEKVLEGIRGGDCLHFFETPVGRLAVVICADVLEPNNGGFQEAVARAKLDFLLVVSMSPKTKDFEEVFRGLSKQHTSVLMVNAACVLGPDAQGDQALIWLSLPEPTGAPPTRVALSAGGKLLRYDFSSERATAQARSKRRRSPQLWKALRGPPAATGVRVLPEGRGLVLDLGAHWAFGGAPESGITPRTLPAKAQPATVRRERERKEKRTERGKTPVAKRPRRRREAH